MHEANLLFSSSEWTRRFFHAFERQDVWNSRKQTNQREKKLVLPMPIKTALYPSSLSLLRVRSAVLRDRPVSIFTPKSFINSTSKSTTLYGRRYCGISDELKWKSNAHGISEQRSAEPARIPQYKQRIKLFETSMNNRFEKIAFFWCVNVR